ncbi:VWA domain-containing protein [Nocardia sp. NPDC127579]|uniref:vWA domain-containing protein n=1 Tax=Nocardia sp. NPDC127579 TaxID=3345402 RepID=UPI0036439CD3
MRITKIVSVVAAGLIVLFPGLGSATAQPEPESRYAPTMLVLDASGSMLAPDSGGGTKMDAAKTAIRAMISAAPSEAEIGLTAYGTGTGSAEADKAAGCRDVRVLRTAEAVDKPAMLTTVDGIVPRGYTPIGTALRTAAEALPAAGPSSIVLVSDGLDTCAPPDPCAVAAELRAQGHEIVVHAIGFAVDDSARAQLTCIAHTTGGTYTDGTDLGRALPRVGAAALRNYDPAGTRVTGTGSHRDAPPVTPGQYLDVIEHEKRRFYALDIPDGSTAYLSATVAFPRGKNAVFSGNGLMLELFDADGRDCHVDAHKTTTRSDDGVALTVAKVWTGATQARTGTGSCTGGGRYYFAVEWDYVAANAPAQLPVELMVGVEPGVSDAGPATEQTPTAFTEPTTPAVPVIGSGSFNLATTLDGSGRYADTLRRGEFVFYKVKLDWGQALGLRVRFHETDSDEPSLANVTLYTPWRAELRTAGTSYTGKQTAIPTDSPFATVPIRYRNRDASADAIAAQSVPGWYYIAVKLGPHTLTGSIDAPPVPVELELTITGSPEPGPVYLAAGNETFGEHTRPTPVAAPATESRTTSLLTLTAGAAALLFCGALVAVVLIRRGPR